MVNILLFDPKPNEFYPFSGTRHTASLRSGISTIADRWIRYLQLQPEHYNIHLYPFSQPIHNLSPVIVINVRYLPTDRFELPAEESYLSQNGELIIGTFNDFSPQIISDQGFLLNFRKNGSNFEWTRISSPFDLVLSNSLILTNDFVHLSKSRNTEADGVFSSSEILKRKFIDLDCSLGSIHIGKNVTIGAFSVIEGPCSIGEGSVIRPNSHIRAGASIGEFCTIGGEVKRTIIDDYSNKSHFGYIGDSYIGKYCNLGAGTSNSNMKNTIGNISSVNTEKNLMEDENKTFIGLLMGDHCKVGIYSKFNAGSKIGAFSNLFGHENHDKYIRPFTFGCKNDYQKYDLNKAIQIEERFAKLKSKSFSESDRKMAQHLYDQIHRK